MELYSRFFQIFAPIFEKLIDQIPEIAGPNLAPALLASLLGRTDERTAFRYLAAPPISQDDLCTLAESTLSSLQIRQNPDQAMRIGHLIFQIIDPYRFPWVREGRSPTQPEREHAIIASAALVAARKVETARRGDARKQQELKVKSLLGEIGFREVPRRRVAHFDDAPAPGEFCGESKLGDTRADLVVRLRDRRAMAIECKVSNSGVNSFKRINHEAVGKAAKWFSDFGKRWVVPSAVLSGVFHPSNLETAQEAGLALFWAFRLDDLANFIRSAE